MKKTAQDLGSHWNLPASRVRTEEFAETTCDSDAAYLGFRLVHDAAFQVFRGGCWFDSAQDARVAFRLGDGPAGRFGYLGFRLAREST
jgi:formylglycine-generating enzyme required for sulfatase activity